MLDGIVIVLLLVFLRRPGVQCFGHVLLVCSGGHKQKMKIFIGRATADNMFNPFPSEALLRANEVLASMYLE
jgi:hypothetical protein